MIMANNRKSCDGNTPAGSFSSRETDPETLPALKVRLERASGTTPERVRTLSGRKHAAAAALRRADEQARAVLVRAIWVEPWSRSFIP